MTQRVSIMGGPHGEWAVTSQRVCRGEGLARIDRIARREGDTFEVDPRAAWTLRGVRSHERYLERDERERLVTVQANLGRPECRCAALIPIRKSDAWWALAQDERREIFEARSTHIAIGYEYLPPVARRLYHGRDLGEPFDFLTWFEFEESAATRFEELVGRLRETPEWEFVEREIDFRLRWIEAPYHR